MPTLQKDGQCFEEDNEKAQILLQTFFPPQPKPQLQGLDEPPTASQNDPIAQLLTEQEIKRAIFSSNPRKAPGLDDIPFRVWQEL